MFKKYFDKIYCINYIEAKDRRSQIIDQFKYLESENDLEFLYGIPLKKIKSFNNNLQPLLSSHIPTISGIGCSLSHYMAIKQAYELGYESVLIFEDDAVFLNDINTIYSYLDKLPNDWEYLYLTPTIHKVNIKINQVFNDVIKINNNHNKWIYLNNIDSILNNIWISSCAYALKRSAMEYYINLFESRENVVASDQIEYFYRNINKSPFKTYISNIRLIAQSEEIDVITKNKESNKFVINTNSSDFIPLQFNVQSENFIKTKNLHSIIR